MKLRITVLLAAALLGGCSSGMDDMETYVSEVKGRKTRAIEPIPQIKQYEAFAYVSEGRRDPFVRTEPPREAASINSLRPDLSPKILRELMLRNADPLDRRVPPLGRLNLWKILRECLTSVDATKSKFRSDKNKS